MYRLIMGCAIATSTLLLSAAEPEKDFYCVDFQSKANHKLAEQFHNIDNPGNDLAALARGDFKFGDVKFTIGEGLLQLANSSIKDKPEKIAGLELDLPVAKLHFLHGTGFAPPDGTKIGEYTVHYADKTTAVIPIVYGEDVRDWWDTDGSKKVTRGKEAWRGTNKATERGKVELRLYTMTWENPHPEKDITKIDYSSTKSSIGAPFCIAITAELK
jgi:hypothetical protein